MVHFDTQNEKFHKSKVKIIALFEGSRAPTVGPSDKYCVGKAQKGKFSPLYGLKAYRWSKGTAPFIYSPGTLTVRVQHGAFHLQDLFGMHFEPHRKHTACPVQKPTSYCNCCVMLQQAVYVVTTVFCITAQIP
jgi:hypothetical protein